MQLYLRNSLSGVNEPFTPADPERVTMYVCGPTVYDLVHIGNARPVVIFDLLYRVLRRLYPEVVYARNITDVDDKINAAAKAKGQTIGELTRHFTREFQADMYQLGALEPDIQPKATDHIEQMITMVQALIRKGHAYQAEGHVLFHVPSFPAYGQLSRRKREEQIAGARVEVAPFKRDPADFVLWKPSDADQPGWSSPWGRGRPGWHLECSAMIESHLGVTIDIHAGGRDLIFPHHENEIAQSTCAHDGEPYVRYWLHNGHITVGGQKMSKSVGNMLTVRSLLRQFSPQTLRYGLLAGHYRQSLEISPASLQQSHKALSGLYQVLLKHEAVPVEPVAVDEVLWGALLNDLNTPQAIARLHSLAGELARTQEDKDRTRLKSALLASGALLGLLTETPSQWLRGGLDGDQAHHIQRQVEERLELRKAGRYAEADAIRAELLANGVTIEDCGDRSTWHLHALQHDAASH